MVSSPPAMSTLTVVGVAPAAGSRSTKVSAASVPGEGRRGGGGVDDVGRHGARSSVRTGSPPRSQPAGGGVDGHDPAVAVGQGVGALAEGDGAGGGLVAVPVEDVVAGGEVDLVGVGLPGDPAADPVVARTGGTVSAPEPVETWSEAAPPA